MLAHTGPEKIPAPTCQTCHLPNIGEDLRKGRIIPQCLRTLLLTKSQEQVMEGSCNQETRWHYRAKSKKIDRNTKDNRAQQSEKPSVWLPRISRHIQRGQMLRSPRLPKQAQIRHQQRRFLEQFLLVFFTLKKADRDTEILKISN